MSKTLYDLKVGDEVIVATPYSESVEKVERLTTNFVIVKRAKYRKSNGSLVGRNGWLDWGTIYIATPEDIERIRNKRLHNKLVMKASSIPFQSLTNDQLQSIINIARQPEV